MPRQWHGFLESWLLTLVNWLLKILIFGWIIALFAGENYSRSLAGAIGGELTAVLPIHGIAGLAQNRTTWRSHPADDTAK